MQAKKAGNKKAGSNKTGKSESNLKKSKNTKVRTNQKSVGNKSWKTEDTQAAYTNTGNIDKPTPGQKLTKRK